MVAMLLLALFAAAAPAFGPSASAQGEVPAAGPVTIQALNCPFEYTGTDYLNDCTDPGSLGVSLTDQDGATLSGETDANGDLSFAVGATGDYSLEYGLLGEGRATFYYACFDGADVFLFDGTANVIDFSLTGDSLFCRIYTTLVEFGDPDPATASGEFRVYTCPENYAGDSFLVDCPNAPAGDTFRVFADGGDFDVSAGTDANGVAAFAELPTGEISVALDIATVSGDAGVDFFCYNDLPGSESFLGQGNTSSVDLTIEPGLFYFCDFYVTPLSSPVPANAAFQVFECPVEYAGDDYLTDCAPLDPSTPSDVLVNEGDDFDFEAALTGTTGDEGRTLFETLDPGTYLVTLNESERVNTFYHACFEASSGSEEFLFAGESIQFTVDLAAGDLLSCRWYIIPFELPGDESASPSASPSAAASVSASARPSASAGPVGALPNTGTGAGDDGGTFMLALAALVAVALAAATVIVTRRPAASR